MKHSATASYENNFEIIELKNDLISAKIAVNMGNTLFSLKQNKDEKMYFPFTFDEYKSNLKLAGNPFLHPWANRLEADSILVENHKHLFPEENKHLLYRDGNNLAMHGLLLKSENWKTIEIYEDEHQCFHLAEFVFDDETFLSIFPFKHTILMKHQLQNNKLSIETTVVNEDEKAMPISFGFHPYFLKTNENLTLKIPTNDVIEVDEKMIPTGNIFDKNKKWNFINNEISLKENAFDDGFQNLQFEDNIARFSLDNIEVQFDKNYPFAQIYAPKHRAKPYVCIEPMTAATNSLNKNLCKIIAKNESFTANFSIVL